MEKKEAMKILKDFHDKSALFSVRTALDTIIPELKESEDEKIRKELLVWLKSRDGQTLPIDRYNAAIAWLEKQGEHAKFRDSIQVGDKVTRNQDGVLVNLSQLNRVAKKDEKQGEQKPAEWSEEDEENLKWFEKFFRAESVIAEGKDIPQDRYLWFKNLKGRVQPKQEWSEDTQQWIDVIIKDYEDLHDANKDHRATIQAKINILKSLRPQSQWRPSEEMLEALYRAIPENTMAISEDEMLLDKLYQGLKYGRVLSNK